MYLPDIAERLHEILADEGGAAVRRRHGQFEGATPALAGRPAAGRRAAATAASVASVTARAAAAGRAGPAPVRAAPAVLQVEEAFLRVERGGRRVVVVTLCVLVVERVHLVDVLLLLLVAVRVNHAVAGRAESQSNNAILVGYR